MQDFLLNDSNELIIRNGDLAISESTIQEVALVLELNQGELKSDPILGPNLFRHINAKGNKSTIETKVRLHLARDGKDYDKIKSYIEINAAN